MGLSDDLLRNNQRGLGGNGTSINQPIGTRKSVMPKPTRELLQQWAGESKQYANQGGGGVGAFIKDYGRNAAQLGVGLAKTSYGRMTAPFMMKADAAENGVRALLGANNPNTNKHLDTSFGMLTGGASDLSGLAKKTAGGIRDLLGWQPASSNENLNQTPVNNTPSDVVPMTPRQQASIEYNTTGSRPTSVPNIREVLNAGVPTYTNINPSFDDNGKRTADTGGLNIIPSLQGQSTKKGAGDNANNPQVPAYNPGTQTTIIEDSTRGGYYQQKKADRQNQKTIEGLNNKNKENWQLNRQAALDNSLIANQSESRRLLSGQADIVQRNNELDKVISDVKASPEQRMQAMQTRNLLNSGGRRQNNIVTKLSEEMPDGSKRERAVTIDPSTGGEVSDVDWRNVNAEDYINEIAKRTGRSKEDIRKQLGGNIS